MDPQRCCCVYLAKRKARGAAGTNYILYHHRSYRNIFSQKYRPIYEPGNQDWTLHFC